MILLKMGFWKGGPQLPFQTASKHHLECKMLRAVSVSCCASTSLPLPPTHAAARINQYRPRISGIAVAQQHATSLSPMFFPGERRYLLVADENTTEPYRYDGR